MTNDELRALIDKASKILFAYEGTAQGSEGTGEPWWAVVRNGSFDRMVVLDGPFFSRERATMLLEARRYEYGQKAYVYCYSGNRSQHYRELRETVRELANALPALLDRLERAETLLRGISVEIKMHPQMSGNHHYFLGGSSRSSELMGQVKRLVFDLDYPALNPSEKPMT